MAVLIGTSGWQYPDWKGPFYPSNLPQGDWLEWYANQFQTVESNSAFYRLPERPTFVGWASRTPRDFVMAVKMSRFLTHMRRLREPNEPVAQFLDRAAGLGDKLGPVLLQLPPRFPADPDLLDRTLACFPSAIRVAIEFRDETWFQPSVRSVLERHRAALCIADRLGVQTPLWRTTHWTYLRLHEGRARPRPCYGRRALDAWTARIARTWSANEDVYVFFNNDHQACAPRNAAEFIQACARAGLPSRAG